jgi:hypothetical protein
MLIYHFIVNFALVNDSILVMSRRSESAPRRDAVGFHQKSTTFIDNYKPIGAAALLFLAGTYKVYDHVHKTRERKLKGKIVQNEWNVSQNALYASNEDLEYKKYMNQIAKENAEFEQRHRLDEIGHPEWGRNYTATAEYSSYPVERYQEPQQWQPWEEEVDERSWYEKKRWQGLALGGIACASTAILSTEREHAEETPPWAQKNLATAAWGVGIICTGAAIANAFNKEERDSESRSAEKRRGHRSNRHSSRAESKHPKSSSRRR